MNENLYNEHWLKMEQNEMKWDETNIKKSTETIDDIKKYEKNWNRKKKSFKKNE